MIYPMMLKVDFQSVKNVGKRPKGIIVTCVTNWLIKLMVRLKSYGYVLPCPIGSLAIKTLVGGGGVERTEVAEVRPELVVVEIGWIDERGELCASAIPCRLYGWVSAVDIGGEFVYRFWFCIASHECYARDVAAVFLHEAVVGVCRELAARVRPEIWAVATGTAARTVGYVNGESNLVRYLLKNYREVGVFHAFTVSPDCSNVLKPLPGVVSRSCLHA